MADAHAPDFPAAGTIPVGGYPRQSGCPSSRAADPGGPRPPGAAESPVMRRQARLLLLVAMIPVLTLAAPVVPCLASPAPIRADTDATDLHVGGAVVHVTIDAGQFALAPDRLIEWVRRSAAIVAAYYGVYPVPAVDVRLRAVDGEGVRNGQTFPKPSPGIRVNVGRAVSETELLHDWVLVHEMVHLALPEVGESHAWLSEGLATYVEGVARVQAGNLGAREFWQEEVTAIPKGMPRAGDEGLDHTHTWGRTYWGGALFCLVADVTIRERTGNRRGLQDALRGILRRSGGIAAEWPIERVFGAGDAATGTAVLAETYRSMRDAPSAPDLDQLWRRLGLRSEAGIVRLESGTRNSEIREAITRRPAD